MQRTLFSLVLPLIISCHNTSPDQAVTSVLNNLHLYAAEAKGSEYFDLFADDAIFFGTDTVSYTHLTLPTIYSV